MKRSLWFQTPLDSLNFGLHMEQDGRKLQEGLGVPKIGEKKEKTMNKNGSFGLC